MVDECVVSVYPKVNLAQDAIHRLIESGFPSGQVSLVTTAVRDNPQLLEELKLSDDSAHDAAVGAGLGGVLGILGGAGVVALTRVGAMFLVGPLWGGMLGGLTGAFIGAMSGWGVHDHKIQHYQQLVERGQVIVIAVGDPVQLAQAYRLLYETGPSEVHTYARMGDEHPETP